MFWFVCSCALHFPVLHDELNSALFDFQSLSYYFMTFFSEGSGIQLDLVAGIRVKGVD